MRSLMFVGLFALAGCATPAARSGMLTSYEGLAQREGTARTAIAERRDDAALAAVKRVRIEPAELASNPQTSWMNETERALILREVDAQVCFEVSERYAIVGDGEADARVRTVVTGVKPTGRVGSAAAAAASFFIPGPIGLRAPLGLGGLSAESEMLDASGRQLAALTWSRAATAVGTDNPSLSRIGDALQFAEPFGDTAAAVMTPKGMKSPGPAKPDPCAGYGPRIRPEGFLARFATGLYVPQMSGARAAQPSQAEQAE